MSSALIVMVHGSPRAAANADMYRVLDVVRSRGVFDIVEAGFMECNEPTIAEAIDAAVAAGARSVVAVPYFLHTGAHVADDLPGILDASQRRHPDVELAMGKYIGVSPRITDILAKRARTVNSLTAGPSPRAESGA